MLPEAVSVCRFRGGFRELRGKAALPAQHTGNENGRHENAAPA